jgi:hypothetical protein
MSVFRLRRVWLLAWLGGAWLGDGKISSTDGGVERTAPLIALKLTLAADRGGKDG